MPNPRKRNQSVICSICNETIENHEKYVLGVENKVYHLNCARDHKLIKCCHSSCKVYMKADEVSDITGRGLLCPDHFKMFYNYCSSCGKLHSINTLYRNGDDDSKILCPDCLNAEYFICEHCNTIHLKSEIHEINIKGQGKISLCHKCLDSYKKCSCCNEYFHKDEIFLRKVFYKDRTEDESICEECRVEKFNTCSDCHGLFHKDLLFFKNNEDLPHYNGLCERCQYKRGKIYNYHYKPRPVFQLSEKDNLENQNDDVILFGIENEIEINRDNDESKTIKLSTGKKISISFRAWLSMEIQKLMPDLIYQKSDGSLSYGIELVSHPMSLQRWIENYEKFKNLFEFLKENNCYDTATTSGMHVHISRKKMSKQHMNTFTAFIHGNKNFISKVARRRPNSYSKIFNINKDLSIEKIEENLIHHDRYEAVNWNNSETVEVRIFQSTLNIDNFLSNIEFCGAAYNFTKVRTTADVLSNNCVDSFKQYVNDGSFTFLPKMLENITTS